MSSPPQVRDSDIAADRCHRLHPWSPCLPPSGILASMAVRLHHHWWASSSSPLVASSATDSCPRLHGSATLNTADGYHRFHRRLTRLPPDLCHCLHGSTTPPSPIGITVFTIGYLIWNQLVSSPPQLCNSTVAIGRLRLLPPVGTPRKSTRDHPGFRSGTD